MTWKPINDPVNPAPRNMYELERAAAKLAGSINVMEFRLLWPDMQEQYKNRVLAMMSEPPEGGA
ncbi:hypothetical protein [Ruegeria jejuensis]|uniref:hypothetical protein n=1 Tax=Ruegeria jejuensis TaxID=3233338 RepID=UPI00355B270E